MKIFNIFDKNHRLTPLKNHILTLLFFLQYQKILFLDLFPTKGN